MGCGDGSAVCGGCTRPRLRTAQAPLLTTTVWREGRTDTDGDFVEFFAGVLFQEDARLAVSPWTTALNRERFFPLGSRGQETGVPWPRKKVVIEHFRSSDFKVAGGGRTGGDWWRGDPGFCWSE